MKKKKKELISNQTKTVNRTKPTNGLTDKTILVVNTGSIKKKFIFHRLKKLGLTVVVLHKEKNWAQTYVDHWILSDTANHMDSIRAVEAFAANSKNPKIDGVITFWEDDVLLTSKLVDKFNLVGIPFTIARRARNKFLFREFCQAHAIKSPKHKLLRSLKDTREAAEEFEFPIVIKPVYGASSAYVIRVDNGAELLETYNYIRKNISTSAETALSDGLDIFIEEYIDGDEVDIDILLQNGKVKFFSISDNYKTNEPFFVETGQAIPSSLPDRNQVELIQSAEETLEKLGILNGCIHYEAKLTKTGPVPIEINLRMGGDEVWSFIKGAWDVDLIENAAKIALGEFIKVDKPENPKKYLTGFYFLSNYSGMIVKQDIDPEVRKKKYLEELHFFKQVGDPILVPPEGYEFLGWITTSGDNLIDAQDNLNDAKKYIEFDVVKFDSDSAMGKTSRKSRFSSAVLNKDLLMRAAKIEHMRRAASEDLRNLFIGVAYNSEDKEDGNGHESVGHNVRHVLVERGYRVKLFDFKDVNKAFKDLRESNVDLVFNACDQINSSGLLEPHAASVLELLQIPYTGSNYLTLGTCIDKIKVKKILKYHEIPTPKWDYAYSLDDEISSDLSYPLIVKPSNTDNLKGITNDSVVQNKKDLDKQLKHIIEALESPALIEEYIDGDEYDVTILGSAEEDFRVLPLTRTMFNKFPDGYWHIYSNDVKQNKKSLVYGKVVTQRPPKNISKRLESLITEIALDTYNILDCQDYGRVEIKVDKNNNPYVLELNPNPFLGSEDYVVRAAKLVRMNFGDLVEEIIRLAVRRYKTKFSHFTHLTYNLNF